MTGGAGPLRRLPLALAALVLVLLSGAALAQSGPFGVGRPEAAFTPAQFGPLAPAVGWIAAKQAELYRLFAATVRAVRTDWSAAGLLVGLAFLYGVLHAAGPGHGKAVIASYLLASREALRRGAVLSLCSALLQGATAVVVVAVFAVFLRATSFAVTRATAVLELASAALVLALGVFLLARKLWGFVPRRTGAVLAAAGVGAAAHGGDGACCAPHALDPGRLAGPLRWRSAAAAVVAVGLRPCTGAILVLVFALGQNVFPVGLLAVFAMSLGTGLTVALLAALAVGAKGVAVRLAGRRTPVGTAVVHLFELASALAVLAFGLVLFGAALSGG